nr:hypothetical protein [uncultured bacterium]
MMLRTSHLAAALTLSLVATATACSGDPAPAQQPPPSGGGSGGGAGTAGSGGSDVVPMAGVGGSGGSAGTPAAGSGGDTSVAGTAGSGGTGGMLTPGSMTITLDTTAAGANVGETVENYPLAIQLDSTNFDFAQASAMGEDVSFEKPDGTVLPHSIEHWDATNMTAALWVKVDSIAGNTAGQEIIMRWGNPGPSTADSKAVFSLADGFYGVWHLDEDGNTDEGGFKDASEHEVHGTGVGMIPGSRVPARIGMGAHLDNPEDQDTARWIKVTGEKTAEFNSNNVITASVWALAYSYPIYSYETIFCKGDTSWSIQRVQYAQTGYQSCLLAGGQPGYHLCIYDFAAQPLVTEEWLHFMLVLENPNMTLYINGELNAEGSGGGWNQGDHDLGIGNQTELLGARRQWDGIIDEPRVMQVARSISWAKLDYESQREGQTLITYGAAAP